MAKLFNKPGIENQEAENIVNKHSDKSVEQIGNVADNTVDNLQKTYNSVKNTSGQDLNPQEKQNDNFAVTGGTKGSLTGKNFNDTLRLMRRADKYNNKPVEDMIHYGSYKGSGIQNLGAGYNRPKIETEEMREMERNRALDKQQKELMIQLQDAINHKDLDAFISVYEKKYGVRLSEAAAQIEMRKFANQQGISTAYTKDVTWSGKEFLRALDAETVEALTDLSKKNPVLGDAIMSVYYGIPLPDLSEQYLLEMRPKMIERLKQDYGLSDYDASRTLDGIINITEIQRNTQLSSSVKKELNPVSRFNAYRNNNVYRDYINNLGL